MKHTILLPQNGSRLEAEHGEILLDVLRLHHMAPKAPCGGNGTCGKCRVVVNSQERLACQTAVEQDLVVEFPQEETDVQILVHGCSVSVKAEPVRAGYLLAFDIGTTTVVCYLLDNQGKEIASSSMLNPQSSYGADVVSRIQLALRGEMMQLTGCIREGLAALTKEVCKKAGIQPEELGVVSVVANPCMQQLFLGISPENLASIPFSPVITHSSVRPAREILPLWNNAALLTIPDIAGYVGADTMGCILSTRMYEREEMCLLVDIGTNGEMVLGNSQRIVACSTAAGPALEGATIRCGMRAAPGAIDHVWVANGQLQCSVIGGGTPRGICGSGIIDAVACLLELKLINQRGKLLRPEIRSGTAVVPLLGEVALTQDDIQEVLLAKGAIAAGIELMVQHLGITAAAIDHVLLAGAFGSYVRPESACAIGLLPPILLEKVQAIGNAAGSGAKLLACSKEELPRTDQLLQRIESLELARIPNFQRVFAQNTRLPWRA